MSRVSSHRLLTRRVLPLFLGTMLLLIPAFAGPALHSAHAFSNGQRSSVILGQVKFGSVSQYRANGPEGMTFDPSGNIWVADYSDNRVLRFPAPLSNGVAANLVIGQPDFASSAAATSQSGLYGPTAVSFDSSGNLWVTDSYNHRILRFSSPFTSGMNADLVVGQSTYTTNQGKEITTGSSLYYPYDARFDSVGNLWLTDCGNDRVLRYSSPFSNGMNANLVLGQADFTSPAAGTSQTQTDCPVGLAFDPSGNLWVSDYYNNRVLRFGGTLVNGMSANLVLGQSGFTTSTASTAQSAFNGPWSLAFDSSGNLLVVDSNNFRVQVFTPPFASGMSALLGEGGGQAWLNLPVGVAVDASGNAWVSDANNGVMLMFARPLSEDEAPSISLGQGQNTLTSPAGMSIDSSGNLWVSDRDNDRVLQFLPPFSSGMNANLVLGQSSFSGNTYAPAQNALGDPWGVTLDASGNLWVVDGATNRILRFSPPFANSMNANLVLGQSSFTAKAPATSQTGINFSTYIAFDSSGNLWVSDTDNNRILRFPAPVSSGEAANLVLGQSGFTSDGSGTTQNTVHSPFGIAFDSSGNLWVSDEDNHRVLRFSPPFTTGMSANLVLGQTSFLSNSYSANQNTMKYPDGLNFDPRGNLWVADYGNNRVLRFSPPFTTGMSANLVIGQSGFATSTYAAGPTGLDGPRQVAFDSAGNLWVSDRFNNRVLKLGCGTECPSTSLSLSYGLQGGGTPSALPKLTYMSGGVPQTVTLSTTPTTYPADYGSAWSVTGLLSGSSAAERWDIIQATSGIATSTLALALTYYHQFDVSMGYNVTGGGTGYGAPGVTYSQFGTQTTSAGGSTNWVDAQSSYSYQNPLLGSTSTERWLASVTSGTISSATALSAVYYHQYAFTASYSVSGGGSPTAPTLTSSSLGGTFTSALSTSAQSLWLDSGASYSLTNPLGGSTSTERWYTASASGKVTGATTSLVYYHQDLVTAGYSVVGGGTPQAPTLNSTALGTAARVPLSSSASQVWLDAGATYAFKNPLGQSTVGERWQTPGAATGTVSSPTALNLAYYHQYMTTVSYVLIGGGTPTAPTISYTTFGATASSGLTTAQQNLWVDSGTQYSANNPLAGSTSNERWLSSASSGSVTASASVAIQYDHQYLVSFAPTDSSGKSAITPTNLSISIQGVGVQSVQGLSAWLDSGTTFTISSLVWHGVDVKPAASQNSVAGPTTVAVKALIYDATLKVTDVLGLPVSGAQVKVTLANGTVISGTTGGDGSFVAHAIPLGTYTASVSSMGSSTQVTGDASKQSVASASVLFGTTSLGVVVAVVIVAAGVAVFALRRRSGGGTPKQPKPAQVVALKCPNCRSMVDQSDPFCPNCGAKLR